MERLKHILRQALAEQAHRVKLQSGASAELAGAHGARALPTEGGPIDDAYVTRLFGFLFPNDKAAIAAKQVTRGALNVPNVGKILLIAQPSPPATLRLYLPQAGYALFENDWTKLSGKTVTPGDGGAPLSHAPAPEGGIPLARGPAPVPGGFIPPGLAGGAVLQAPQPEPLPMPMAMPVAEPMPPVMPGPAPGGFVPPLDVPVAAPSPVLAPAPQLAVQQPMADVYAPQQQQQYAPPVQQYAPPVQQYAPPVQQFAPSHGGHGHGHGHGGAGGDAEAEKPVISFAAEAEGETSDGNNAIDAILADMIRRKASDLHMTSGEPICFRVDGEIERVSDQPLDARMMEAYLLPIMPLRNQIEFAKINDTDFAYEVRGLARFRVNIFRDKNGVGCVMRNIPSKILTAEQLNLSSAILKFCTLNKGLVLVTGPTGSGKSTTLAAMIDYINKTRHDHILTIEDPVEFVHPQQKCLVNQREVHKHTTSFARALKAALREDPDIVLIGEMRDLETIAIAIETAETGHLVFGTLHTTTAVSTVDRIIDQFPSDRQEQIRMMLSSSLRGVVAQTLLKKKGGGRCAAQEVLVTDSAVSAMIREGKNHMIPNHMQSQKQDGNILLNECLGKLVKDGLVEPEEAYKKAVDKTSFVELMKRMGVKMDAIVAPPGSGGGAPGRKAG